MKKFAASILALLMCCTMFASCGDDDSSSKSKGNSSSNAETSVTTVADTTTGDGSTLTPDTTTVTDNGGSGDVTTTVGQGGDPIVTTAKTPSDFSNTKTGTLLDTLKSGKVTIDIASVTNGVTSKVFMTSDGKNIYLNVDSQLKLKMLVLNNKSYMIIDDLKCYCDVTGNSMFSGMIDTSNPAASLGFSDGYTFISKENVTESGVAYLKENFNNGDGGTTSFYYNGDKLVKIIDSEKKAGISVDTTININTFSNQPDTSKFTLPSGYSEKSYADVQKMYTETN